MARTVRSALIQQGVDPALQFDAGGFQVGFAPTTGAGIGSPMRSWIGTSLGQLCPVPSARWLLMMATGSSGALSERRVGPHPAWVIDAAILLARSIQKDTDRQHRSRAVAVRMASRSLAPRFTGYAPQALIKGPSRGIPKSSALP